MSKFISKKNGPYDVINNPGNGNCLFDSLAVGVFIRLNNRLPNSKDDDKWILKESKLLREIVGEKLVNILQKKERKEILLDYEKSQLELLAGIEQLENKNDQIYYFLEE